MDRPKRKSKKKSDKPKRQLEAEPKEFVEIGGSPVPGLTLRSILRGHTGRINRIAWSPDGRRLASPSYDKTIRIWDIEREQCLALLAGHAGKAINSVAWSADGQRLTSGGEDKSIHIWSVESGNPLAVFEGHQDTVWGVAWSPNQERIVSSSWDSTLRIWGVEDGETLHTLEGHDDYVRKIALSPDGGEIASVSDDGTLLIWSTDTGGRISSLTSSPKSRLVSIAWSQDGETIATGAEDGTIRIWDSRLRRQVSVIEGHTAIVVSVSFSSDGSLLVSKSEDNSVQFWSPNPWKNIAKLDEIGDTNWWLREATFHPSRPVLATLGENDRVIRIWDLDIEVLLGGQAATGSVRYTTAKMVLVGDSGVGKTGLGWRLAHGEFKEHASTHGQQFWVIDELTTKRKDGTECEAVLWDLAGQHIYRPIHAIFLDDVDFSLVLFDPTNRQEPMRGAEFWLEQLSGKQKLPPTVLVGARVDRGAPVLSQEELDQFCQRYSISGGYISTSAMTGDGLDKLLEIIKAQIPWEQMTATVTTVTFKRIKEFVLALKEKPDRKGVLVHPAELRRQLQSDDPEWQFTDAEMMTAVKHLENHGYVAILHSSSDEESILLTPELLVDLASSIVLQADKHPRELGALSETALLQGGYPFAELANLEQSEQQVLLDAAVARFLSHNICFRETLGADALLIFPGLIKQKRPLLDEIESVEDMSYIVRGRVENVYAALVVLLGYTQTFTRVNQWQNQAQYEMGKGEICGFRLIEEREGEIELVLYYSTAMPGYGRTMFQGLFEKFLYQRDVEVTPYPPVVCPNGHKQERATIVKRLREGKKFIFCEECGEKTNLPEIEKPLVLGAKDSRWIEREDSLARLRSKYETHLVRIKGFRRDRAAPRCYISHLSEQDAWVAQLTNNLREAGAYVLEDSAQIQADDFVIVTGTPAYKQAWNAAVETIAAEVNLIRERLRQVPDSRPTVIPLLLARDVGAALPGELLGCQPGDFSDETQYAVSLFDLVLTLYAIPLNHPAFLPLRDSLKSQWEQTLSSRSDARNEIFISYAWGGESEVIADKLDQAFQARGVTIIRDKRDLKFKGRIKAFMESLGQGKCVILIISDKYLKSANCLFELLQVSKHGDFAERIFPVVLGDARIYDPLDRIGYVQYWERRRDELDSAMKKISAANMQGFREDIDLYAEIRTLLPRLAEVLKDMNTLTSEIHQGSDFTELFEAVIEKLSD